jgi:cardiolipin synthase
MSKATRTDQATALPYLLLRLSVLLTLVLAAFGFLAAYTQAASSTILINAIYYDTYLTDEPDEAFQLINVAGVPINLNGWTVTDFEGTVSLTGALATGDSIWIAREADDFTLEFGFKPDYEYQADTDASVPNLARVNTLALANIGDELVVRDSGNSLVDAVIYEGGSPGGTDWSGTTITPYTQGFFGIEGQLLYRKRDQITGRPVPDTDTAADWAQSTGDDVNGKKVQYPGWDSDRYFFTHQVTQSATITYVIAPDVIYDVVSAAISRAKQSIYYEGYTFSNADLADVISATLTANPGLTVTLLLEGAPVGGISDQEKRNCQTVELAGGQCWFMINDATTSPVIHDRYTYQHAKFMVIDQYYLLTGSENLNYSSMPADDKGDGTSGNRGVWLITDSPELVTYALDIFDHDHDPIHHRDLVRWNVADPRYGAPTPGFEPDYSSGGTAYTPVFTTPLSTGGEFFFEVLQSPDNSLRSVDGLLGMVSRAGSGDEVLVEQLYEHKYWGATASNPATDPNVRLEAYIEAARRGASVHLLLDSVFDNSNDPRGNTATCSYVNGIGSAEKLDLHCLTGNPTGSGIHNKMVLVRAGAQGWVHTGSINGSENSSKANRELAVQVRTTAGHDYLAAVFWHDWTLAGGQLPGSYNVYLPLLIKPF